MAVSVPVSRLVSLPGWLVAVVIVACGSTAEHEPAGPGAGGAGSGSAPASVGAGATGGGGAGRDACSPGSSDGFAPHWVPPADLYAYDCKTTEFEDAARCILGGDCAALDDAPECLACAISAAADAAYGPAVRMPVPGVVLLNQAGCVAATAEDASTTECAATMQAALQCEYAVCEQCEATDYPACMAEAADTSCAAYAAAATSCYQHELAKGGRILKCDWPSLESAEVYVTRLVTLFCGYDPNAGPCDACKVP